MERLKKWQARGKPLWAIVDKSRRVGVSALSDGLGTCHCMAKEMAEALIVAHQHKSSQALFQIPKMLVRDLPMHIDTSNAGKIVFPHDKGDSTLTLATAGSVVGGRGMTLTFLHGSEVAYWPGAESFASLLPAVSRSEDSIIILESTANGTVGQGETFYQYWNAAVEGRNDFCPIFLTHLDDPACRLFGAKPADIGDHPDIADYEREMLKLMKKRKIAREEQHERIAWVRATFETQCQGIALMLQQEFPLTSDMSFIATGFPAFEPSEMSWANECLSEPMTTGRFQSNGKSLPGSWEVRQDGEWQLWQLPQDGHFYYLGADAAAGEEVGESGQSRQTGDFAAICIWDGVTGEQVAEMSARISPDLLADECNKAGRYYNNAMANIELTGNLGRWAQVRLRDHFNYPSFYRWKGRDDYIGKRNAMHTKTGIGWDTNPATRELMFAAFRAALRDQRVKPRSKALVNQMRVCSRIEGFRWDVRRGHDDILLAALIAWIAREQWAPPVALGGKKPEETEQPMIERIRLQDDASTALMRHHAKVMAHGKVHYTDRLIGV